MHEAMTLGMQSPLDRFVLREQGAALAKSTADVPLFDARALVYLSTGMPAGLGRDWPQNLVRNACYLVALARGDSFKSTWRLLTQQYVALATRQRVPSMSPEPLATGWLLYRYGSP